MPTGDGSAYSTGPRRSRIIPHRGEVWWVDFSPSIADEIKKIRPAVVLSPDSIGRLRLTIVVPLTDWDPRFAAFPWFVEVKPNRTNGLDQHDGVDCFQIKSISRERLKKKIGVLSSTQMEAIVFAVRLCIGDSAGSAQ